MCSNNRNPYMSQITITRLQPRSPETKKGKTAIKSRNETVCQKKS